MLANSAVPTFKEAKIAWDISKETVSVFIAVLPLKEFMRYYQLRFFFNLVLELRDKQNVTPRYK